MVDLPGRCRQARRAEQAGGRHPPLRPGGSNPGARRLGPDWWSLPAAVPAKEPVVPLPPIPARLPPGPRTCPSIRNLSIVAHVDHGKSTLSDRILELTGAVDARDMREQYLDSMDIERERGITIKAQNVRVEWKGHTIHLIDTPGHVDFGYEVSRSLAACEGVVLLVDAAQGIEAQTLANGYQAIENDLEIVGRPQQDRPARPPTPTATRRRSSRSSACPPTRSCASRPRPATGVAELLDAIVDRIPPPTGDADAPAAGR